MYPTSRFQTSHPNSTVAQIGTNLPPRKAGNKRGTSSPLHACKGKVASRHPPIPTRQSTFPSLQPLFLLLTPSTGQHLNFVIEDISAIMWVIYLNIRDSEENNY